MQFTLEEQRAIEILKHKARQWRVEDIQKREQEFYSIHGQKKGRPRGTTSDVSKVSGSNPVTE